MDDILKLLGPFPEKVSLDPQILEEVDCGSFIRQKVIYRVEAEDSASAYICIPKNISLPAPAIFCHHQHHGQFELGKNEVVGLAGDPDQAYAKELAERGFITFSPDAIAFEERQGDGAYAAMASRLVQGKTLTAKVLHDVSVGLDYLESRPEVDRDKIGFIGHSYGGRMALWSPAFDKRIKVSVSNCGCIPYRLSLTSDTGIQMEFCIPGFMKKFDIEDVVRHAKQCSLLVSATKGDKWSRGAEDVYNNLKAAGLEDIELKLYEGGHQFTAEMREYAYNFFSEKFSA